LIPRAIAAASEQSEASNIDIALSGCTRRPGIGRRARLGVVKRW